MAVTLELRPETEAAAAAEAQTRGTTLEHYLQTFLEQSLPFMPSGEEEIEAERQRRWGNLSRLQGKYAHLPGGSEEFSAQKAVEKALEERHWERQT